jgi:hypothetical protein
MYDKIVYYEIGRCATCDINDCCVDAFDPEEQCYQQQLWLDRADIEFFVHRRKILNSIAG